MDDREFMETLEEQLLAGAPSIDPLIIRRPRLTPEGATATFVYEVLEAPPLNPNQAQYFR